MTRLFAAVVVAASSCVAISVTSERAARAEGGPDTSHGRVDGDLSASLGLGAAFGPRGPRGAADMRVRYLWTAGVFATYEDGPLFGSDAEPRRAFAFGAELRPLFLAR